MTSIAIERPLTHRVSWGALFAAFFVGFGIWLVLLALGAGIGLAAFDPRSPQSWQGLGVGFGIWGGIAAIISVFLAGWTAARLSSSEVREEGMLHGVALWGFMLVASLWLAATAVGGAVRGAASVAGTAAQAAGEAAGGAAASPQAQGQAQQATGQLQQQAQETAQQLQQQAPQAAETAASIGTRGAWGFFITGLLTLAAAALGGSAGVGKVRNLRGREERAPTPGRPLEPQRT